MPIARTSIQIQTVDTATAGAVRSGAPRRRRSTQAAPITAAYFEMLGEQGFPGLLLFLLIHGIGLVRMEVLRRRYRNSGRR